MFWKVSLIEELKTSFVTSDERPIKPSIHSLTISNSRNLQKALGTEQVGSNNCPQQHPGLHPSAGQRSLKSRVMFLQFEICHGFSSANLFSCFLKS